MDRYTAAGYSGRMPMAELADAIVESGRQTLISAARTVRGFATRRRDRLIIESRLWTGKKGKNVEFVLGCFLLLWRSRVIKIESFVSDVEVFLTNRSSLVRECKGAGDLRDRNFWNLCTWYCIDRRSRLVLFSCVCFRGLLPCKRYLFCLLT